ncbi:MAG: thioredoxin [Flavobacterium sp. BFFFF1]|uniref:thioredoxin family protein n=1 Tax=Flavobacterium sp. BFFFF1 TaxID=2015557 RepID=UPI000BCA50C8|nr:thioredoxin family protein [Flavobacterium sp. BFFFF1]OYU79911.1 MAG: thioredoxin [Flavobacterium sp. BFFFF1]
MKKLICFVAFMLPFLVGFKGEVTRAKGIEFYKGSFAEALKASKETGKPIFIDVFATWCGPCRQLKKSFRDDAVGTYYNKNFICFSVDGETAEGRVIRGAYNISSYPTLLIVNQDGKQLARTEGYMKPYILINFGRRVIP